MVNAYLCFNLIIYRIKYDNISFVYLETKQN